MKKVEKFEGILRAMTPEEIAADPNCRGSYFLGGACGDCPRCARELEGKKLLPYYTLRNLRTKGVTEIMGEAPGEDRWVDTYKAPRQRIEKLGVMIFASRTAAEMAARDQIVKLITHYEKRVRQLKRRARELGMEI